MSGLKDAYELAAELLKDLEDLRVGPMVTGELARRLAAGGLAALPYRRPEAEGLSARDMSWHFKLAIEIAGGRAFDIPISTIGITWSEDREWRRWILSFGGVGRLDWDRFVGDEAFAGRVLELITGACGAGFEVGFGLGRTRSRSICLRWSEAPESDTDGSA